MKHYKEFNITSEPFLPEIICGLMWELDITGINEDVNCVKVFANADSTVSVDLISNILDKLVGEKMLFNFSVEENLVEEKNWNEEWEKSVNVIEVTDKLVIKPTFKDYLPKPGQIIITIDPKMSFGTGEHQTTKLVMQFLESSVNLGIKVLDVGSGTGVLAIAAVKLGAESAIAVDNDEWCYNNGSENVRLNEVENVIDVRLGEIKNIPEKDFDIITANIQKNILIDIAEDFKKKLKPGGLLLLSGLLYNDEKDIINKYSTLNFELLEKKILDDWIALKFLLR